MNRSWGHLSFTAIALAVAGFSFPRGADEDTTTAAKRPAAPRVGLLVPAYFYPAAEGLKDWQRLLDASAKVPTVAIVNPASGPGKMIDPNYRALFARAKKTPITLIGYVSTTYGKRALADVKADIDTWVRHYPDIQGIFFDEQASGAALVDYQVQLLNHVRTHPRLKRVVTNPGTICAETFFSRRAADTTCIFEGAKAFDPETFPAWAKKYNADRFCTLSYKIEMAREMKTLVQVAVEKKIGFIFITDGKGANPWDRLPSYWEEEVKEVQRANPRPVK